VPAPPRNAEGAPQQDHEARLARLVGTKVLSSGPLAQRAEDGEIRLDLLRDGDVLLRYDNEPGKGDHRHIGDAEERYRFKSAEYLLADFWADVEEVLR